MATNYPGGFDSLSNPSGTDPLDASGVPHASQHANANDAIEAIEATLGLNPQSNWPTVSDRIAAVQAGSITPGVITWTSPGVISVNSASDGLRITQTGTGNALVVEDSANPDSSPFVVNQNGQVFVGSTGRSDIYKSLPARVMVEGVDYLSWISSIRNSNDAGAPVVVLGKSRGTAVGGVTVVASGDTVGQISFQGADGAGLVEAASIQAAVDGTPGTNDMPGRLVFSTTADGASSPTERMRIDNAGLITGTGTSLGAWTAYTPTLGGETTAPTLGTGSSVAGYYCQVGKTVYVIVKIIFGTSGTAAGTGFYTVSLPVTARTTVSAYASLNVSGRIYDASATTTRLVGSFLNGGGGTIRLQPDNSAVVGAAVPWAWAASDEIWLAGTYEAA